MNKVFFRIIETEKGIELHCSADKRAVVRSDACSRVVPMGNPRLDEFVAGWRREMFQMGDHMIELDDAGRPKKLFSVVDVAGSTGLSVKWIQKLATELIHKGHAQKVGKVLVLFKSAIKYVNARPRKKRTA